jgi:WD40 repeat protein/energy-coupling factor transporter ATP-binding protein EcfA2
MSIGINDYNIIKPSIWKRNSNPFPGLRPFNRDESFLYFGREKQVQEIIERLFSHHFIALIGTSGSGKSSLMNSGLIPAITSYRFTNESRKWIVIISRPGIDPVLNLYNSTCTALADYFDEVGLSSSFDLDYNEFKVSRTYFKLILKSIIEQFNINVLILIDQFEEHFRKSSNHDTQVLSDSNLYVDILTSVMELKDSSLYLSISLRSDFIGDAATYPELTNYINRSHYLIPQMTSDQMKLAIEGPITIAGAKINSRLTKIILDEISNNPDKLPIVQHALMRTWEYWINNKDDDEIIDLRHYQAIGKISQALSIHADEIFSELDNSQKNICEQIFKVLTEKGRENYGVRRQCTLADIVNITNAKFEDVIYVIDRFRQTGRSLLMPSVGIPLNSDTVIEISHESLMRIWGRLTEWVNEEAESAQMYQRLSDASELYHLGRTGLWRPPDLQLALNWRKKQNPNWAWAQRYNPLFERTMVFLNSSQASYEAEQKIQVMVQRKMLGRAKMVSLVLGIATVISMVFFVFAIMKKIDAEDQAALAIVSEQKAISLQELAEKNQKKAQREANNAIEQKEIARLAQREAESNYLMALKQQEIAEMKTVYAENLRKIAEYEKKNAIQAQMYAQSQASIAEERRLEAYRMRILTIAQSMAVKSIQVSDPNLKGGLALHAFNFNLNFQGNPLDNYVYDGLYYALRQLEDERFYKMIGHRDAVRDLVVTKDGKKLYSSGSDGKILEWDLLDYKKLPFSLSEERQSVRKLDLSNSEKYIAAIVSYDQVKIFNLESKDVIIKDNLHGGATYDIEMFNDKIISCGMDSTIRLSDYSNNRDILLKWKCKIKELTIRSDILFGLDELGNVFSFNLNSRNSPEILYSSNKFNEVTSLSVNQSMSKVAIGNESGQVVLLIADQDNLFKDVINLSGHSSRINDLEFSFEDRFLATAGFDGKILLWNLNNLENLPITMRDHNSFVWSISFSPAGNYLFSGDKDRTIHIWPTSLDIMADRICTKLERSLSIQEWDQFIGLDVPYEKTCLFNQ